VSAVPFQVTDAPGTKPVPLTVSGKFQPPWVMLAGESDAGAGFGFLAVPLGVTRSELVTITICKGVFSFPTQSQ